MPITPAQSKPFSAWFDHAGCGGFAPYNRNFDTTLPKLVEKVLARAFRRAHQMEVRTRCGKGNKRQNGLEAEGNSWKIFIGLRTREQ